ncbi:MAG: hypothetical protein K9H64_20295 [Bacteroidales bacterium]|nr:hypothetical protein [Bacteroidales bacterium]MCF8458412.1 hypothetical protein [Bacteroidales bacterium]
MKTKSIFLLAILICLSFSVFSQPDVEVYNLINTPYNINAVYYNGANYTNIPSVIAANDHETLKYEHPGMPNYFLVSWRIQATMCTPILDANMVYGVSDWDAITHCQECASGNAYASYFIAQISPYGHEVDIACKDN